MKSLIAVLEVTMLLALLVCQVFGFIDFEPMQVFTIGVCVMVLSHITRKRFGIEDGNFISISMTFNNEGGDDE